MMLRWALLLAMALPPFVLVGCGPGRVSVSGEVTLDSQPLADAQVLFQPVSGGRPATGKTDAAGKFTLSTDKPGDGVAPGDYQVAVTAVSISYARPTDGSEYSEKTTWRAPKTYADPKTSGLKASVTNDNKTFKFDLSSKP